MDVFSIRLSDPLYPELLKEIFDPPSPLYYSGNIEILKNPRVAIVGTRDCTAQGEAIAFSFAKALSLRGITIVSGLAFGIDASAHLGALEGGGGTIAVLANPLPQVQPSTHTGLAKKIIENGGLLLSEKSGQQEYYKSDYLVRNRIIAGLCKAVLVVEAGFKSGALNTASHALDNGREVLAIPGRITDDKSAGTLKLIRDGGVLISSPKEVAEALGVPWTTIREAPGHLDKFSKEIFSLIQKKPKSMAELCEEFPSSIRDLCASITTLEMQGFLRLGLDQRYFLVKN
ncbi:MAG: DNA-processing protein DprA [Candidatus Gracilibacteria bacterium]